MMGRKCRVDTENKERCRNGIRVKNPGDKLYAAAEYSTGFYKQDNLIPSSTWRVRKKEDVVTKGSQPNNITTDSSLSRNNNNNNTNEGAKSIPYTEKYKARLTAMELQSVAELQIWESRTGLFTKTPKTLPSTSLMEDILEEDFSIPIALGKLEDLERKEDDVKFTARSRNSKVSQNSKKK